jgi:hypothetical protein
VVIENRTRTLLETLLPRHLRGAVITGLEGDVEPVTAQTLKVSAAVPQGLPLDVQWKIAYPSQIITITRPITVTAVGRRPTRRQFR